MARITTFEAGYCTHIACMALKGAGWKVCKFPARSWLLSVGDQHWLWDTGYAEWFERATRQGVFHLYRRITPVHFDPREAMVAQLAAIGLRPGDLQAVLLSHFHGDHMAGLKDFPGTPIGCSQQGWLQTRHLQGVAALRQAFVPDLVPTDIDTRLRFFEQFPQVALDPVLQPFTQGYALPGSQGDIVLVPLPGHAAGHFGAFVRSETGWVLLASDAAWSPTSYQELRGPSALAQVVMDHPPAYYQTLHQLHQLWRSGGAEIRLSHEGDL